LFGAIVSLPYLKFSTNGSPLWTNHVDIMRHHNMILVTPLNGFGHASIRESVNLLNLFPE